MMLNTVFKKGLVLSFFACGCTILIAGTYIFTIDRIEIEEQKALEVVLNQVIPKNMYDNDLFQSCVKVSHSDLLSQELDHEVYVAKQGDKPVALAIETVSHNGYSGDIHILLGVDMSFRVLGVRTLKHQETPGLGDKIQLNKSDWVLNFNGRSYEEKQDQAWQVKKDGGQFDQFTGATITPRAYVETVKQTLKYLKFHQADLFDNALPCRGV